MAELIAKVISQKGVCSAGHKTGDEFLLGELTPPGLCSWAYESLLPFAKVIQFGGTFPFENTGNKITVACPDPENPVVFEIRYHE